MKRVILSLAVILVLLGVGYFGYNAFFASSTHPSPAPVDSIKTVTSSIVSAEGNVAPVTHTTLAFKTSGRIVEIPVHEGDAVKAGAILARLDDTTVKAQIAQAEAALAVAQSQRVQLRAGSTQAERQAAEDAVASARAAYAKVKAGPTVEQVGQLKANLDNAQAVVSQAQTKYDRVGGDTNPFGGMGPERLALQQATNNFLAAQAAYRDALSHPTTSELKAAASSITQAESAVARLDPTPEQLALADAQVAQAQAALDLAKTTLPDEVLTAPFDGTIVDSQIELGEVASPGAPAFTFANLAKLQVETTDLAEVDVTKIAVGQSANIKVDALPDKTFAGQVQRIALQANDHRGDQVYQVTIHLPEETTSELRWGMTANVEIETGQPSAIK